MGLFEALIQKLEAAVEWDEQLDREIEEAVDSEGRRLGWGPYPYTSKIDAARGLLDRVLPGWSYRVARCAVSDDAWVIPDFNCPVHGERLRAELRQDIDWSDLTDVDLRPSGREATALCISILKALEIINAQSHQAADGEHTQQEDETLVVDLTSMPDKWPPVKKALWDVVVTAELNSGKYVNAWDLTERLFNAVQATAVQQSPVAEVMDRQDGFVFSIFPDAFHRIHIGDLLYTAPPAPAVAVKALEAFPGIDGFGASFSRDKDAWVLYTTPSCDRFGQIDGFNSKVIDWILGTLRSALSPQVQDVAERKPLDLNVTKEWFEKRASLEGDHEIGAGRRKLTAIIDPTPEELAELYRIAHRIPEGWQLVPVKPTHAMIKAMSESKAKDDEGEFPFLSDLLNFSGENKTHTVLRAAYRAMLAAAPASRDGA